MEVRTVTTTDRSLLGAVRCTLEEADEALCCVAFAQEKGVHLLERELEGLQRRGARSRLLVTTTFSTTTPAALGMAHRLGMEVRVINPGSGITYHPKLYLGSRGPTARAVIGSANLTGGLATNLEAAVAIEGRRIDAPLAGAWEWGEALWADPRAEPWRPVAAEGEGEVLVPELYAAILAAWRQDPVFPTLGRGRPNRVAEVTPAVLYVETERSRRERGGPAEVPAWMFNLAWDRLRTHGVLTHAELLNVYRVHRSAAVFAVLGRLPPIELASARPLALRWRGG